MLSPSPAARLHASSHSSSNCSRKNSSRKSSKRPISPCRTSPRAGFVPGARWGAVLSTLLLLSLLFVWVGMAQNSKSAPVIRSRQHASMRRTALVTTTSLRAPVHDQQANSTGHRLFEGARGLPSLSPLDGDYEHSHAFSNFSNWLVPGHLMVGRYPFVEPSHCPTRDQGERQIARVIAAGITTFVCLQEELPAQNLFRSAGQGGFLPYKQAAEAMKRAFSRSTVATVQHPLIAAPLGLLKEEPQLRQPADRPQKELEFLYSPIVDLALPSPDAFQQLLVDLRRRLIAGEKLYIHCWGGCGRAGTVGSALLATAYALPVDEVFERVQRGFYTRGGKGHKRCPETDEQFGFIRQYVRSHSVVAEPA